MGYKRLELMDLYDIVRRWHGGSSISAISRRLSKDRKTIRKYIRAAEQAGLRLDEPLPDRADLLGRLQPLLPGDRRKRPARRQFEDCREEILEMTTRTEDPLKPKTAYEVITERYGIDASYSSFKRFMRSAQQSAPRSTCRIEVDPGEEIQIDYGKMGLIYDPVEERRRVVYGFIGTLSHSRLKFVEFTYSQDQRSFVGSHRRMFEAFEGTPRRLVIDNLKAGVLKPDLHDPKFNPLYQEMSEHYGCFIDPARPGRPQDKGKVERAVPLARELFRKLKELHPGLHLGQANRLAWRWCREENGQRVHGTTGERPLEAFHAREQEALQPLPGEPFRMATWKSVRVHADQYVQFDRSAYSVPRRYVGEQLWARATERTVEIFDESYQLVKIHPRTQKPRRTDPADFPAAVRAVLQEPTELLEKAGRIGPKARTYAEQLLEPGGHRSRRKAAKLAGLTDRHPSDLLEEACQQALRLKIFRHEDLLRVIDGLKRRPAADEAIPISAETNALVRSADYFIHA